MPRCVIGLLILAFTAAACSSPATESDGIRPTQTLRYDIKERPTAPAPIEGDFREDESGRIALNSGRHFLLIFIYSQTCGNCIAMRPHIAALEAEYWGKVDVIYLNHENLVNYEIFTLYEVESPPEFILLNKENKMVEHWRGAPPIDDLRQGVDALLAQDGQP